MNFQFKPGLETGLEKVGQVFLEPTRPGPKRYYLYRVFYLIYNSKITAVMINVVVSK
jgi:hypothetical protein